jgi:hypothetical protein
MRNEIISKCATVFLFVFIGIPGVFLFLFSLIAIFGYFTVEPILKFLIWGVLALPLSLIMILVGARKTGEWKYIFVFLSIFIAAGVSAGIAYLLHILKIDLGNIFGDNYILQIILFFGVPAIIISQIIKKHYKKRREALTIQENKPS